MLRIHTVCATVLSLAVAAGAPPAGGSPPAESAAATSCYGPHDKYDVVRANGTDAYRICFLRGDAQIRVSGDTDSNLDCYVYNSQGVRVAIDDDDTDYCVLDWTAAGGAYRLRIVNRGSVSNMYHMWTN